jgi:tripeptide aminopeptidase
VPEALPAVDAARVLDTFLELVSLDSPSRFEGAFARRCAELFAMAGCVVQTDDTASLTGSDTGNLIVTLPGTAPGRVYVSAHMDTVEPGRGIVPVVQDGVIRSAGDTVLGGDDKSGIAAILEAVRVLAASHEPYPEVKALLTVQEEQGLVGAFALDSSQFDGEPCFVLDAAGAPGTVVVGAPYQHSFTATFVGRAAHAGVSPEKGVSAIAAAAAAVAALSIGRIDDETTANVGTITGGTANNIVAERCVVTGECRSHDPVRLHEVHARIDAAMSEQAARLGASATVEWVENYEGFRLQEDDPIVAAALAAAASVGLEPRAEVTGGGADTNVFSQRGLCAISLGTGMSAIHSTEEFLAVKDLEALAAFLVALVRRFARV